MATTSISLQRKNLSSRRGWLSPKPKISSHVVRIYFAEIEVLSEGRKSGR